MAKLIDILAREMKVWPESVDFIGQSRNGRLIFDRFRPVDIRIELADDVSRITRAEWQAAVDALKAAEVSYSAENVSVDTNYVTHTSSPINSDCKIVQPEWNGDPEPMTPVEFMSVEGVWKPGVFVGRVYGRQVLGCDETQVVGWISSDLVRPARTSEQVAAEEREKAVNEALSILPGEVRCKAVVGQAVQIMVDAGYRKP